MNQVPTVYLVDDDDAVRDSLTLLIETAGLRVSAFSSAESFLEAYRPQCPGCLLLDLRMPGMAGIDLQAELDRLGSELPIIFLSAYGDIPTTVRAIKNGAIDFLTKPVQPRVLLERLQAAIRTDLKQREQKRAESMARARLAVLTPRETEVARLLVEGLSNKEIALRLGISHRTVENHRAHIMEKTGIDHLIQLARMFEARGEG